MGVIVRQGLKHSLVTFVATFVGMINILFIYTFVLTKTELGFYKYFISTAELIQPFILLGFGSVAIRYFPKFRDYSEKNNGFLFFLLTIPFLFFLLFLFAGFRFQEYLYSLFEEHENKDLILTYLPYLPILIFAMMYNGLLSAYISNFKRIVLPEIFNNLWIKIATPSIAIIYFFDILSFSTFLYCIFAAYLVTTICLLLYLVKLGKLDVKPNRRFFDKPLTKDIATYATFSVLSLTGHLVATRIDTFMVGSLTNADNVAVYTIAFYIATVIGIPFRSLSSIVSPIISESFSSGDLNNIKKLYSKTSLNLFILGTFILIGIWVSVDLIFDIIPNGEDYKSGKYVILLLGLAKIIDMVTGMNYYIIAYSKFFQYNLYFGLILACVNIFFNLQFIPNFGILGAAFATLASMFIFNSIKYLFILYKLKMQPFSWSMVWVLAIAFFAFTITCFLPNIENPFIDIILNSIVITLVYVPSILYFNLSDDLTKIKQEVIKKGRQLVS